MKESSTIAMTYARTFVNRHLGSYKPAGDDKAVAAGEFLESKDIHLHFPEGAIPKDGPSAGIAIATSLVGLAIQEPCL